MNTNSRIRLVLSAASLLMTAPGCAGKDTPPSGNATRLSGSVDGLSFGSRVSAIAGTFWGADDGLDVAVTDADDPCDALTSQRRQPNTSVLVLGFLDALEPAKLSTASVAHSGAYQFVTEPFGAGRWFRVVRAYHLDGDCAATTAGSATAGAGSLNRDVPLSGGTAVGHFSAQFVGGSNDAAPAGGSPPAPQFVGGSLSVDFEAPFCPGLDRGVGGCTYFDPGGNPDLCTCGTGASGGP